MKKSIAKLPDIVVIGASLGGLAALSFIFKRLNKDFRLPLAVVLWW